MSTLEINKMVAALLTTGIVAGFSAFLAGVIMHPPELEEPSYVVAGAVSEDEPAAGAEGDAPADDMAAMMASAEEVAGEKVAKKCSSCHTFDQGGANKIGPNLWNVLNRSIAGVGDFGYSDALTGMASDSWSREFILLWNSRQRIPSPMSHRLAEALRLTGSDARLISSSSRTPSRRFKST